MPRGFFRSSSIQTVSCGGICKLDRHALCPRMPVGGHGRLRVMIIGEAPDADDDKQGEQFVGQAGGLLKKTLAKLDVSLHDDCWKTNACQCRPMDLKGNNRKLEPAEIDACRPRVLDAVREYRPSVILLMGSSAVRSVIGHRWTNPGMISRWRGWTIPDYELGCWICPTFHPNFIMRGSTDDVAERIWLDDLERALNLIDVPVPDYRWVKDAIETAPADVLSFIDAAEKDQCAPLAFDYETSGLKPDRDEHFLYSIAISNGKEAAACLVEDIGISEIARFAMSPVEKIAHNAKYEERQTRAHANCEVHNWQMPHGDTMLNAHVLDNRPDICSLEFQAFVHFGLLWKDETKGALKAADSNSLNKVAEIPIKALLRRNAIDALVTRLLWEIQTRRRTR